jgi:carboxypeptidase C (cathepsin A)
MKSNLMLKLQINLLLFCFMLSTASLAQDKPADSQPIPEGEISQTKQSVTINGVAHSLITRAGTMQLKDEANEPIALFGFTSYMKEDGPSKRPIIFAYNGGPGSSSFWLHMGVLGPKRIVVNDPNYTKAAPYTIENNEYSILDVADLVMIDPVGTGLSVAIGKAKFSDFWGVDQDIRSISLFIMQYLKEYDRYNSPKFLLGESYGTFRNAGVMNSLLQKGVAMNGVIMVSAVFDLRTLLFPPNDDLPYIVNFPTLATTAWYHNKVANKNPNLEAFVQEVRTFTEAEYVPALFKGTRITAEEKAKVAKRLSYYSGLSEGFWMRADLKVKNGEFYQELLRDEGNTVGRLDSRYKGINSDLLSQFSSFDPQSDAISPAYISGFMDYFFNQLKVSKKLNYVTSAGGREGFSWDWKHTGNTIWNANAAINTAPDMAEALNRDPNMKVLIMNGYYDLATVFYGVEHTLDHMDLRPEVRKNIKMTYYEAGHMMYTQKESLIKFKKDLADFIKDAMVR